MLRRLAVTGIRAALRVNHRQSSTSGDEGRRYAAPQGQWTLWSPIALAALAALVYQGYSASLGPSGCLLLLTAIQSYFVVWCMIVGAVPVGFRWLHSETEPYGFSIAAIAFLLVALALGFAAIATAPG